MPVRVTGLDDVQDALDVVSPARIGAAEEAAGHSIVSAAGPVTPRRSGALADNTTVTRDGDRTVIANPLPYAGVIHNGWPAHNIAADPFITSTAQRTTDVWLDAFVDELDKP